MNLQRSEQKGLHGFSSQVDFFLQTGHFICTGHPLTRTIVHPSFEEFSTIYQVFHGNCLDPRLVNDPIFSSYLGAGYSMLGWKASVERNAPPFYQQRSRTLKKSDL